MSVDHPHTNGAASSNGAPLRPTMAHEPARDFAFRTADEATANGRDPLHGLPHLAAVAVVGTKALASLASREIVWAWNDIAPVGTIVMIAGAPGCGKTSLMFLIIAARVSAVPLVLLGRTVQPAKGFVVVVEAEHSEHSAALKIVASCKHLGVAADRMGRVILIARRAVMVGSIEWREIVQLVKQGLVSDIVLDTLARVTNASGNDEREQAQIFNEFAEAIESAPTPEQRPNIWVLAHTRKPSDSDSGGRDLASVGGSVQRTGQCDSVLLVRPKIQQGRVVSSTVTFAKLREEPGEYPKPVTFAITREGISYHAAKTIEAPGGDEFAAARAKGREFLRKHPATSATELSRHLGIQAKRARALAKELVAEPRFGGTSQ